MGIKRAWFRFYEELNDFLPEAQRYSTIERTFELSSSVKDMIESFGVPHTEIDLVIVNGESVDFSYRIADGDRVSVYPAFESLDVSPVLRLRPEPLRDPRFSVDANLGQLARYLRLLGFDTTYERKASDAELADTSQSQRRLLLTRDVGLLKRRTVTHGYYVRAVDPRAQVIEVLARFDLTRAVRPFSRCTVCNAELMPIDKADVVEKVPPGSLERFEEFRSCPGCGRIYWEGSHMRRATQFVDEVVRAAGA
ncbi:MAG: Mut7-C RNAse domain-containing protein [Actinomycetota bacterium]